MQNFKKLEGEFAAAESRPSRTQQEGLKRPPERPEKQTHAAGTKAAQKPFKRKQPQTTMTAGALAGRPGRSDEKASPRP